MGGYAEPLVGDIPVGVVEEPIANLKAPLPLPVIKKIAVSLNLVGQVSLFVTALVPRGAVLEHPSTVPVHLE